MLFRERFGAGSVGGSESGLDANCLIHNRKAFPVTVGQRYEKCRKYSCLRRLIAISKILSELGFGISPNFVMNR